MREIHHRVKNNLQIILSLLSGQIDKLEPDQELKSVLVESQNKIKSMAIIHQNLYKENQYAQVSVSSYITELVDNIKKSFDKDKNRVHFDFNVVKEHIQMSLAVPLGLIVNELVTNSYKYAFTKGNNEVNRIKIEFEKIEDTSKYRLIIKDNGIGLPVGIDINNLKSYGLELVQGLVSQLNGTMEIIRQEGTSYHIMLEEPRV
jgi:two-component sensor histidine kinase